jgi:nitrite reductase/ring-hydroxylating ferredoxin subunit
MNIYIKIFFYFLYSSSIIINKTNSFILPQIFREWTPVAIESKIDRTKPFSFNVGKLPMVLWYDNNNSIISTVNICKHLGSKLDTGFMNNGCLHCPNHYTPYNISDKIGDIKVSNGLVWWSYRSYSKNPPMNFKITNNNNNKNKKNKYYNSYIDVNANIINVILEFVYSGYNNNFKKEGKTKFLFKETLFKAEHRYLYKYPYYLKGNINKNINYAFNFAPLEENKTRIFITINDNVDAKIYMNYYLLNKISNIKNYETDINYLKYLIILKDSNNNYMKKIYNLFDKYSFPNEYNAISFYKYRHFY